MYRVVLIKWIHNGHIAVSDTIEISAQERNRKFKSTRNDTGAPVKPETLRLLTAAKAEVARQCRSEDGVALVSRGSDQHARLAQCGAQGLQG